MRAAFADEMEKLALENEKIILLSGDIGNRMFDQFKSKFPKRFYNCGIAEANMTSMAAGLAMCGFHPVTYTISAFNTIRCLEQIRIDICYQNLSVIIVGVGGGLSYASLNATHQSLEDIASLRIIPNMTVICPGDAWEVRAAIREAVNHCGPVYIRMAKKNEPLVHKGLPGFKIGKGIIIRKGKNICILSTGSLLPVAVEVSEKLTRYNHSVQVVSMHTVKPLDQALLRKIFSGFKHVITLEEHSLQGGFGSSVSEWLVKQDAPKAKLSCIGTYDKFMYEAGGQEHARQFFGISSDYILKRISDIIN